MTLNLDQTIQKVMQNMRAQVEKNNKLNYEEMMKSERKSHGDKLFRLITEFGDDVRDPMNPTERFDLTQSLLDNFYENIDFSLDQLTKNGERVATIISSVYRPQDGWKDEIDNSNTPFFPKLREKPNALEKLEVSMKKDARDQTMIKFGFGHGSGGQITNDSAPHPYYYELSQLKFAENAPYVTGTKVPDIEKTACVWVDTEEKLVALCKKLEKEPFFGVDIEGHTLRSFQGFVCLIQISTRREDFVIDPFPLRKQMHLLNGVFTNPDITKIIHGGENDIIWLQRDFSLYMVNVFDSGQAARVLDYQSFSFSYLLKRFCNVDVDKKYQVADWRFRPVPKDMVFYARQDTHYLPYIYEKLCLELGPKYPLVMKRSRDLCMARYEKPMFVENAYQTIMNNSRSTLSTRQETLLKTLFKWRDELARREDESPGYVLPNHLIQIIVESLPKNINQMLQLCHPVPPLLKTHKEKVFSFIATKEELVHVRQEKKKETEQGTDKFYHSIGWTENAVGEESSSSDDDDAPVHAVEKIRHKKSSSFYFDYQDGYDPVAKKVLDKFGKDDVKEEVKEVVKMEMEEGITDSPKKSREKKPSKDLQEDSNKEIQSLNDIYSISQKNKGNKAKKILKQEIIKETIPVIEQEPVDLIKPVEFMKKIGWIQPDEPKKGHNPYSFGVNVSTKNNGHNNHHTYGINNGQKKKK